MYYMYIGYSFFGITYIMLKVALNQKILEKFYFSKINIPNHYPEQKIGKLFTLF